MKKYKLFYLPGFLDDLNEAVDYITDILENPQAASDLIKKTDEAIQQRLQMPLGYEPFLSKRDRKNTYYRIYVGNYIVFYVVIDDVMEVRRFIYGSRDFDRLL